MGRKESDEMSAAQIFYPCMQASDVFFLKADICQLGIDQRKVNMLAREYAGDKKMRFKPVVVSHHMLSGLKEGQEKMVSTSPVGGVCAYISSILGVSVRERVCATFVCSMYTYMY